MMPKNFFKVDDRLFRGGKPSANDLYLLKNKYGVQRIVSLDFDIGNKIKDVCKKLKLEHFIIPLTDGNSENLPLIENNIKKLFNKTTYVHCRHGRDRTGMVCAIYRIHTGWPLEKALKEAYSIGMGLPLDPETRKSYYDAVIGFANKDSNFVSNDIYTSNLTMEGFAPGISDYSISSPYQMSWAPYAGDIDTASMSMNVEASSKIYTLSKSSNLLNPSKVWFTRVKLLNKLDELNNAHLYSANIDLNANINRLNKRYNKVFVQDSNIKGFDIVEFNDGVVVVLNPNALINIQEEDTSDDVNEIVMVGARSNYDGMSQYVAPGSGGMMDMGYGGFGGYVQLPGEEL